MRSENNALNSIIESPSSDAIESDQLDVPQASAEFGSVRKDAEQSGKVPQAAERSENHTLTVKEVARMFETAGVARTERSIINWCQPNRQGIKRLDCYYDPNERKYYITPQSVEMAIQEEIQRSKKPTEPSTSEHFGSPVTHVKQSAAEPSTPADERKIQELEREVQNLKIANEVKDKFIELMKNERVEFPTKKVKNFNIPNQLKNSLVTASILF